MNIITLYSYLPSFYAIKKFCAPDYLRLIIKYCLISVLGYLYICGGIYALVDFLSFDKLMSYIIVYATVYFGEYFINMRLLFYVQHKPFMLVKYLAHIAFFFALSSLLYALLLRLDVQYILAVILVVGILFPLRFFSYKILVFR